jgi:hypothetical protein
MFGPMEPTLPHGVLRAELWEGVRRALYQAKTHILRAAIAPQALIDMLYRSSYGMGLRNRVAE